MIYQKISKFNSMGILYFNIIQNQNDITNIEFRIIIGPVSPDTLMESHKQKHMLAAYNVNSNEYFVVGYLTSKKGLNKFSDQQIKAFQSDLNNLDKVTDQSKIPPKAQYFHEFDVAERIPVDQVKVVKNGTKYIKVSNQTSFLKKSLILVVFVAKIAYDYTVKSKKPDPKTEQQLKDKKKTKQKNELKKAKNPDNKPQNN